MNLREIRIKHFRSFIDESVRLDSVTALVGPNGAGKSNILHALNFFYSQSYPLTLLDFYNRMSDEPMSVTLTFADLSQEELEHFGGYVDGGILAITKEATWADGSSVTKYHGSRLQCPDFAAVRGETGASDRKSAHNAIVDAGQHAGLDRVTRGGDVDGKLAEWEAANPGRCTRQRDEGQFFGWTNVGHGRIDQFSKWIFIPAVREASTEAVESKGNALKGLLDLFLRPKLEANVDLQQLREESSRRYKEILDPTQLQELKDLGDELTRTLNEFAPETRVSLGWQKLDAVSFPLPTASTQLGEGDFLAPVEYAGHGTQRAFLIAMLQHLVKARILSAGSEATPPHILLGIEEPELYLHPIRSRLVNRVLRALSKPEPGRPAIQSVYGTHSPHFVDVPHFPSVRQIKRIASATPGQPAVSKVHEADLEAVAQKLAAAHQRDASEFTWDRLQPRLASVMTPMISEGFFADLAVLVEGEEDRAFVLAGALLKGVDLEAAGVAVIPVLGKSNLDKPFVVFTGLGVRCFVIFDGDAQKGSPQDARADLNQAILRLCGQPPVELPDTHCWDTGACFKTTMGTVIKDEVGATYSTTLDAVTQEYGYAEPSRAEKNPLVVAEVLKRCAAAGHRSAILDDLAGRLT